MNKYGKPEAYVAPTKDTRFAGTFEVLVPVEGRNKPTRVAQNFPDKKAAEGWMYSDEGQEAIRDAANPGK